MRLNEIICCEIPEILMKITNLLLCTESYFTVIVNAGFQVLQILHRKVLPAHYCTEMIFLLKLHQTCTKTHLARDDKMIVHPTRLTVLKTESFSLSNFHIL